MKKGLEERIVRIPERIREIQDDIQRVLEGISEWTKNEDYIQLRLLLPRLKNLILKIDTMAGEIDENIGLLDSESNKDITVNSLLQQKAVLMNERSIIKKILDDIMVSSQLIENSERARLTGEILSRCRALENSVKELL